MRSSAVVERLYDADDSNNGVLWPAISSVGDLDGDGKGDVALFSEVGVCNTGVVGRVLGSTRDWDPQRPIYILPIYQDPKDVAAGAFISGTNSGATVGDFDGDGRMDIATVYRQSGPDDATFIQFWYPGRDEVPNRAEPETPTGPTAHTGSTQTPTGTETGIRPRDEESPSDAASRPCGCSSVTRSLPTAWWSRRRAPRGDR